MIGDDNRNPYISIREVKENFGVIDFLMQFYMSHAIYEYHPLAYPE